MAAVALKLRAPLNTYIYLDTGDTAAMKKKLTHCLTLRTLREMDLLVSDAAYEAHLSKAAWIRRAIHAQLGEHRRTAPLYATHAEARRRGKEGA